MFGEINAQMTKRPDVMTIREPSTACMMIDSRDRPNSFSTTADNFSINSSQSMMPGYFHRIGVQEVCLQWAVPNIGKFTNGRSSIFDNTSFEVELTNSSGTSYIVAVPSGQYTISQLLDQLVLLLNTASGGKSFSITTDSIVGAYLTCTSNYAVLPTILGYQLGMVYPSPTYTKNHFPGEFQPPNISTFAYVDITSPELTYSQDVKDSTTSQTKHDVLFRWYFSNDNYNTTDTYGFPVFPTYRPFNMRRNIAFPKQIKWFPIQQMGNLTFTAYATIADQTITPTTYTPFSGTVARLSTDTYSPASAPSFFEYQMTLLLSEN